MVTYSKARYNIQILYLVCYKSDGNLGIGTTGPDSTLQVGDEGDSTREYMQIDAESGAPAAGDCDANAETGRLVVDYTNNRFYVCNALGTSRNWDYIALTD